LLKNLNIFVLLTHLTGINYNL